MRVKLFVIGIIILFNSMFMLAALDLQFSTAISQSPDPASAGNVVTFTVSFKNTGGAVTNLKIIGGVDGAQIFERMYASIAADKVRTDSFTWTATAGSHIIWFELDPDHTCGDSNYANNRIEKAITIGGGGPAGKPDLTPVVIYSPIKPRANDEVVFSIIIYNKGTVMSKGCEMQVTQNGSVIDTKIIPTVLPVSSNISNNHWHMTYKWKAVCGAIVAFNLDSNNMNAESNENNNTWSNTMKCRFTIQDAGPGVFQAVPKEDPNGPDLTVRFLPIPSDPSDFVSIFLEVENLNPVKSVPCKMVFKRGSVVYLTFDIRGLQKGEILPVSFRWQKMDDGEVSAFIDSNNKNIESNEKNNVAKNTLTF